MIAPISHTLISPLISQGALNLWVTCARKFRHHYVDGLSIPTNVEAKHKMELGEKFHLLMQQQELGMNVDILAGSDQALQRWLNTFASAPPAMIEGDRLIEHTRTLEFSIEYLNQSLPYILTGVYDLLIFGADNAQILDWKTHDRSPSLATLEANWQTRLYPYILASTTNYNPEQITMTYWFANTAESIAIAYNSQKHQQTHRDLIKILTEIATAQTNQDFRQLPQGSTSCKSCDFKYRCERETSKLGQNLADISDYPEIAIASL